MHEKYRKNIFSFKEIIGIAFFSMMASILKLIENGNFSLIYVLFILTYTWSKLKNLIFDGTFKTIITAWLKITLIYALIYCLSLTSPIFKSIRLKGTGEFYIIFSIIPIVSMTVAAIVIILFCLIKHYSKKFNKKYDFSEAIKPDKLEHIEKGAIFDKLFRIAILTGILIFVNSGKWSPLPNTMSYFITDLIFLEAIYSLYHTWPKKINLKFHNTLCLFFIALKTKEKKHFINLSYIRIFIIIFLIYMFSSIKIFKNIYASTSMLDSYSNFLEKHNDNQKDIYSSIAMFDRRFDLLAKDIDHRFDTLENTLDIILYSH